ncbi:MAG: hypothetical protein P8X82_14250 [Gemmatimonadales bacterium]
MTLFEYLSVAVSIVLALGLGKLVSSLPAVFSKGRRDWLHASFVLLIAITHLLMWWNLWRFRELPSWNFLQFLLVMGNPVSLYLAAHVRVSDPSANAVPWRMRFAEVHRWFFGAITANFAITVLIRVFVAQEGELELHPAVFLSGLTAVAGVVFSDRRVHAAVGVLAWLLIAALVHRSFVAGPY